MRGHTTDAPQQPRHVPLALRVLGRRFVAANAAYRAMFARDHLIGLPLRQAMPELTGQHIIETVEQVYDTGAEHVAQEWRVQVAAEDTGELRERVVSFRLGPRRDAAGAVVGVNAYIVDVTDAVVARQAAQARAQDVVNVLQRGMLPPDLPVLPSVDVAASYLLADANTPGSVAHHVLTLTALPHDSGAPVDVGAAAGADSVV